MVISTRRLVIIGSAILVLVLLGAVEIFLAQNLRSTARYLIQVNDQPISVEIANTAATRYRGLSGRKSLSPDTGMLFVFSETASQSFVMREMKFPLDIIFISDNRITEIVANAQPEGKTPENIYTSSEPVDYVLEVPGNYADRNRFQVGDYVSGLSFK